MSSVTVVTKTDTTVVAIAPDAPGAPGSLLPSPDQDQFITKRNVNGHCVLQACAGAGKTRCLVEFGLRILKEQDAQKAASDAVAAAVVSSQVESKAVVLAAAPVIQQGQLCFTTFTKAAARELLARFKRLYPKAFVAGQVAEMYPAADDDGDNDSNNDASSSDDDDDDDDADDAQRPRKPTKPVARDRIVCGTFHSLSRRWLKRFAPELVKGTVFYVDEFIELFATWLQQGSDKARRFAGRFSHWCVDELQDIDSTQYGIVQSMFKLNPQLSVVGVGDDAQNIYSWRGSNSGFMSKALVDFPACQLMTLRHNFRSNAAIVHFCNRILDTFESKTLSPRQKPASDLLLLLLPTDSESERERERKRADAPATTCTTQLVKFGWDEIEPVRLWTAPNAFAGAKMVCEEISKNFRQPMAMSGWGKKPERKRVELCLGSVCIQARNTYLLYGVQTELAELGIPSRLFSGESDWFERSPDGRQVTTQPAAADTKTAADINEGQFVTLTTIHSSKGLEWPHVYQIGHEDGFLPDKDTLLDHERRLFFVGCTRAISSLTIVRVLGKPSQLLEPLFPEIQVEIEEMAMAEAIEEHENALAREADSDEDGDVDVDVDMYMGSQGRSSSTGSSGGVGSASSAGADSTGLASLGRTSSTGSTGSAGSASSSQVMCASDGYVPSKVRAMRAFKAKKDAAEEKRAAKRAVKPLGVGAAVRNLGGKDYIWLKQHVFPDDLEKRIEILNKDADEYGTYPDWVRSQHLESDYGTFLECLVHRMLAERIDTTTVCDKQLEEADARKSYSHLPPMQKRRWMETAKIYRDRKAYPKWSDPKVIEATWWVSLCGGLNVGRRASLYKRVTAQQLTDTIAVARYKRIEKLVLGFTKGAQTIREAFTVHVEFEQRVDEDRRILRQMNGELDLCVLRPRMTADGRATGDMEAEVIDFKASFFETDKCRADHLTRLWAYASMLRIMNNTSEGDSKRAGDSAASGGSRLFVNRIRITNLLANVQFVFNLEGWNHDRQLIEHLVQRELDKREMAK